MRHYELVTILSPMLSQDQTSEAHGQINDFITNRNGDIFQEQPWGTRRLAYPIHQGSYHFLEGNYRLIRFSTETPFNQALENYLRMDERVLRSLVISIPNREILPDPVAARPAPAAAAPAAEGGEAPAATEGEAAATPAAEAGASAEATTESIAEAAPEAAVETETAEAPAEVAAPEAEATAEAVAEAENATETPVAEGETETAAEAEASAEGGEAPAEEEQSEA
ncbi:MAG: 30S ribosomal protein S6 [Chloroflexota bacterium]|nr:30S ribosomal protein S6 [Chloroflexota bacterium]